MPIESATYISDLVTTNPIHTDGLAQTDSHLRLIKTVLKTTLPNVTGAVTVTQTDLNSIPTLVTSLATQATAIATKAAISGQTFTGNIAAPSVFAATAIYQGGYPLLPAGCIVLWAGSVAAIPAGWQLCDGTGFAPDLRDRFVVGAGGGYVPYTTGGTLTPSGSTSAAGTHSHTGSTAAGGGQALSGFSDIQGAHSHFGATDQHVITISEMPSHTHQQYTGGRGGGTGVPADGGGGVDLFTFPTQATGGNAGHGHTLQTDGAHAHILTISSVAAHAHGISADGLHTHTVSISDGRPPFYSLCYIMKL